MTNAINVICPYKCHGMWVFDDPDVGLHKEAFVAGADDIIDAVIAAKGIENADTGFRLIFSAGEFPGCDVKFDWVRGDCGGNWYAIAAADFDMEGWLCPALFKYFDKAPKAIYAKFEEIEA